MKDMNAVKGYMQYGFDGENNYRQITFDISDLIDGFTSSDGSVMCYWQRPGDTAAYPCEDLTIDWTEETAVLILSSTETAIAGKCRCQLVFVGEDGTIGKDKIYAVNVPASLTGGDLGDAESIPWVVEVLTARDEAEQAATEAEAWAVGERGGNPVGSSDETFNNNSKYYAQAAEAAAAESGLLQFYIDEDGYLHYVKTPNVTLNFYLDDGYLFVEG